MNLSMYLSWWSVSKKRVSAQSQVTDWWPLPGFPFIISYVTIFNYALKSQETNKPFHVTNRSCDIVINITSGIEDSVGVNLPITALLVDINVLSVFGEVRELMCELEKSFSYSIVWRRQIVNHNDTQSTWVRTKSFLCEIGVSEVICMIYVCLVPIECCNVKGDAFRVL